MKRILLFLVLAAGGLAVLSALGGGLTGSTVQRPPPVVSAMPESTHDAGGVEPPKTSELPRLDGGTGGGSSQDAPIAVDPFKSYNMTLAERATYVDPVSGDVIEILNAPKASIDCKNAGPMRDAAGSPGMRWKAIHIVLYKDKKDYTRPVAEALRANPATGRRGLELFDITADEGYETTTPIPLAPGEKEPRGRTIVRITKNVLIHDYVRDLDVRTSDAEVDYDAQTAEGRAPVEVEAKAYVIRGRGFRLDCVAQRLEILENTEFESINLSGDASKPVGEGESAAMRPRRLQAKGSTLIVRHTDEKEPFTDVRMDGGVHVEMDGGQNLSADSVALRLVRRDADAPKKTGNGAASPEGFHLARMTADGDVRYEGKDKGGALLTAVGPKLAVDFRDRQLNAMRLSGRSLVTWRGEMALPGERPSDRIVSARAAESILFAPDAESPEASLLDLVGTARVECGRVPTDPTPQRLAADRVTLHLRRRSLPPDDIATTAPGRGRRSPMSEWTPTKFAATGGVILEGPRLSGAAREIKGFDLDRPTYRVTATGPDAHLEVADDPPQPGEGARTAAPAAAPAVTAPRRTWTLERLSARENAMGELRVRAGEGGARFAGDSMTFGRVAGAEIRAAAGKDAHLTLEGRGGRDRTIDANTIWLRPGAEERVLETAGRTRTVFWVGDEEHAATPVSTGPGRRVIELRSASRIDISGSSGTKEVDATLSVTLADGGALSARTDGVVTDRLTATTIEVAMVETLPVAGELGFAIAGRRADASPGSIPPAKATAAAPPERFVLDSDTLLLAIGTESRAGSAGALRRVHAEGNVKASGDDQKEGPRQLEGTRFDYDAKSGVGVLLGTEKRDAAVTLGREPAVNRVVSPRIEVLFKDGRLARAVFAAPVRGKFNTKPSTEGGGVAGNRLDRFVLESFGGALTIEGDTATVEGSAEKPVVVQRTSRDATGAVVGEPMTIRTIRLVLTTSAPLGTQGAALKNLVASGAGTIIETGTDPAKREYAVGDMIRYERPLAAAKGAPGAEGILRITSERGTVRVVKGGNSLEGYDVTYDFATRTISAKIKRADLGGSK